MQTMLDGHPALLAPEEPWLMLPLACAVGGAFRGVVSPYNSCLADDAISTFAQDNLPGGLTEVQRELGDAAARIYRAACQKAEADVLIDKTPRYYWIIEELLSMVPDSRVVLLIRNPLAVMSSIITTWTKPKRAGFLEGFSADLLEAPARIANASTLDHSRIHTLSYEALVSDTPNQLAEVQRFIGVEVMEGLHHYGTTRDQVFGDPVGVHRDTTANRRSLDKWIEHAAKNAAIWRLLDDYRTCLGKELLGRLGYDFQQLGDVLDDVRPPGTSIAPSLACQVRRKPSEPLRSIIHARRLCAEVATRLGGAAA